MKKLLPERVAATGLAIILTLVVLFHLLVLAGVVPFGIVWGGRLKTTEQMVTFETVSILLNVLMLSAVSIRVGLLRVQVSRRGLQVVFWLMTGLFLLNTVGNIFSENELERMLFTPLTLLLAIFSGRLASSRAQARPATPPAAEGRG